MFASMALISLLQAPIVGQGGLTLAQPRLTLGVLGPARASTTVKPGDHLVLAFDIQGITADNAGKATFKTNVEVTNSAGKSIFQQVPKKLVEYLPLGGGVIPAFAQIDLAIDTPPGKYIMAVTVEDGATGKSTSIKQDYTVEPRAFDVVRLSVSGDADGLVPVGAYVVGQPFWVHGAIIGFERSATSKQPKATVELRVLGADLKPIVAQPFSGTIEKDVPATATSLPFRFNVPLNKAGSYFIQLVAKDELGKGNATMAFPITVLPSK